MKHRITLITELESEMHKQGYSLSHFSKISGINRGILSATLNGNPPKIMSITQLDTMAKALGKPESWLYELFIEQCFSEENKANWRRVRALLLRCIELNRDDLIGDILNLLMEDPAHVAHVFHLAEELVEQNQTVVAMPFYECVIENERNYHSERLAISHYRLFKSSLSHNIENNIRKAMIFYPFRHKLPEAIALDALLQLANIYYTVRDWEMLEQCGHELNMLATSIYKQEFQKKNSIKKITSIKTLRPLVVYYGQSHIIKFTAFEHKGDYINARLELEGFTDLSWFEGLDEEGKYEVEKFKVFAKFNYANLELLSGNSSVLKDYCEMLKAHPSEILASLTIILESANTYEYDIDFILDTFHDHIYPSNIIEYIYQEKFLNQYYLDVTVGISRYINIYYQLALYQCNRKVYDEQLEKILLALENSVEKYSHGRIVDCLELFRKLRDMPKNN